MIISKYKFLKLYSQTYHVLFFLVIFCLIYLLYPKQAKFKYEFQKGSPWKHEDLIAPFDFPILKEKEVYDAEKDSLLKQFVPYFIKDIEVEDRQIAFLKDDLDQIFPKGGSNSQEVAKNQVVNIYSSLYANGILDNSVDMYEPLIGKIHLNIVSGNVADMTEVSKLQSLKGAYYSVNEQIRKLSDQSPQMQLLLSKLDLNKYLETNLEYDKSSSEARLGELLESLSTTRGIVQSGVRIISRGDIVNSENFMQLESLKNAYVKTRIYGGWISYNIAGRMLIVFVLFLTLIFYLKYFNGKLFWKKRNFTLIFSTIFLTFLSARLLYNDDYWSFYLLPVCILPIIIRTFIGSKPAIIVHMITVLLIGAMAPNSYEYVLIQMVAGIVTIISLYRMQRRGHLVITALLITGVYIVLYFGFELIKEGDIRLIDWSQLRWFAANGLLILITYPLNFIFEKLFGFISDVTLMELSDTNHPLLRKMAEEAPGTFQHSMQVANLAEAAVLKIGGNPMLVRTGALYHDVGKIVNSNYFIENLMAGQNPHESLSYSESAAKIINHVREGVVFANKHKIPAQIVDFIKTHHGTSLAGFFYLKYKQEHPNDEDIDVNKFTYPGPNPITRETAIVMLADGVEAASRSLPVKSEESIKEVIDKIIDAKLRNHELDDAPLTFRNIREIKAIFLEKLKNIYHVRIQYPTEKK
jgi:cyclic-di-AMP phosphodiesterase PgpH